MNTTELRESFKHIHAYQDWQRQCEQLANMLDARDAELDRQRDKNWVLISERNALDRSHKYLSHRLAEAGRDNERLRAALEINDAKLADRVIAFLERCGDVDIEAGIGAILGTGTYEENRRFRDGLMMALAKEQTP